ncbi:MAG: hypothetical protein LBE62_03060 [Azonexus sp.]|jgi:hypothetical protein|nr:hypothetical protein [Azonexus sp.]
MGRKPVLTDNPSSAVAEAEVPSLPAMAEAANQMAALQAGYNDERDLANQLWGQIQMADAISKLTTVVGLTKLREIKETKMYRAFSGKSAVDREGNKIADVGTWDGFCQALGMSRQKVDEDLINLRTFGEEALENLSRIGAGYRELRQFRRLPEDQRTALIESAKAGDKDTLLELAEDLIAKHAKEKMDLIAARHEAQAALDEAQADAAAKDAVLDETAQKLRDLQIRTRNKIAAVTDWPDALIPITDQIAAAGRKIATGLSELETCRIKLFEVAHELAQDQRPQYEAALAHVAQGYEMALAQAETLTARERDIYDKSLGMYQDHDAA